MHKTQVLNLAALGMAFATLTLCYAVPRVPNATRRLPIERFPSQIGAWHVEHEFEPEPEVQRKLPTAKIVERDYVDPLGRHVNLMLLNALDDQDFHKPDACLPGQGAAIDQRRTVMIVNRPANGMRSTQDGHSEQLLYYWVKLPNRAAPPPGTLLGRIYGLRQWVDHESLSLFVRITMADRPQDHTELVEFADRVWKALGPVLGDGAEVVLRD